MELVALNLILVMGIAAYFVGAVKLSKYGFRLGTGVGLAVILFPPYTFYFAFKKLEIDGKALPTSLCAFGLLSTTLLVVAFFHPLSTMAQGDFAEARDMLSEDILREDLAADDADDEDEDVEDDEALEAYEEARAAEEAAEAEEEDDEAEEEDDEADEDDDEADEDDEDEDADDGG